MAAQATAPEDWDAWADARAGHVAVGHGDAAAGGAAGGPRRRLAATAVCPAWVRIPWPRMCVWSARPNVLVVAAAEVAFRSH